MAGSKTVLGRKSKRNDTKRVQKHKKRGSPKTIPLSERKRNKLQVEKLNRPTNGMIEGNAVDIRNEIDKHNQEVEGQNRTVHRSLDVEKLAQDKSKDRIIQEQVAKKQKETDQSMLAQIEMISGFSL
ncbi:Adf1p KNAG_0C00240 [Huiozyma naganishii CBS 8797]|uniref:Uncharacterized protein n=1 Tax=Huiozyma naganishii (strain ATCC MYA-139 / BCRC 22969 / CBS 8797 / KCTC 17520 / NBRC 10181 / NCYC 3082 / Yp74L-3) TaxID=1071383 RepID=J7RVZ6_HUIN7|nr:hypothetical protein KNAG_0C00240 [Kazachstania naganishii CBS 8797]CCK69137.1 hypothetical protein KNAG_0C00240 [Kazachstania naganishii CBS 8797]